MKILKSQMFEGFDAAVASHAFEMKNWRAHMTRVAADEKAGVTGIEKHVAHPAPDHHPLVMSAINENGDVDFEVIDDLPTADEILAAKKNELIVKAGQAEQLAISMVVPSPAKRRLYNIRHSDILSADAVTAKELEPGLISKAATAIGIINPIDMAKELQSRRPAADTEFLKEHAERVRQISEIERQFAQMHSEIDDLTSENVDTWVPKGFQK